MLYSPPSANPPLRVGLCLGPKPPLRVGLPDCPSDRVFASRQSGFLFVPSPVKACHVPLHVTSFACHVPLQIPRVHCKGVIIYPFAILNVTFGAHLLSLPSVYGLPLNRGSPLCNVMTGYGSCNGRAPVKISTRMRCFRADIYIYRYMHRRVRVTQYLACKSQEWFGCSRYFRRI